MTTDYPHNQKPLDRITHISAVLGRMESVRGWAGKQRRFAISKVRPGPSALAACFLFLRDPGW